LFSYAEETAYFDGKGFCCVYVPPLISSGCQMNHPHRAWTSRVQY